MSDFEIVAEGLEFPEGPVVMADGSVIVCEIAAGRLTRVRPDGSKHVIATPGGGPNGAAIGPDGALWVCNNGGFNWSRAGGLLIPGHQAHDYETGRIERIDLSTGHVERVYQQVGGFNLSGPNDLMFDSGGGFWFTDHAKIRDRESDHGGLYYGKADGSLVKPVVYPLDHPNGVGLSPDGRTVYVALTMQRLILAFDITGEGEVAASQLAAVPGRVVAHFPNRVLLDSLAMFADGDIAQATLVDRPAIATVKPDTGGVVYREFPDLLTTNIAFGGPDMMDAWVCLSTTGKLVKTRFDKPGLRLAFNG
jgi:gluconolactonase